MTERGSTAECVCENNCVDLSVTPFFNDQITICIHHSQSQCAVCGALRFLFFE